MSLARKPEHEPQRPQRPDLRIVGNDEATGAAPIPLHPELFTDLDENPSRGIAIGLALSVVGFWLPAAAFLYAWLIR